MGNANYRFLEAYKSLDIICCDIYRGEKGVTAYIDEMKSVSIYESRVVPDWNSDLQQLIALRHLRNRLAHECGTLETEMCTEHDIDWLDAFHGRILQQTDPLALLEKYKKKNAAQRNASSTDGRHKKGIISPMHMIFIVLTVFLAGLMLFLLLLCI